MFFGFQTPSSEYAQALVDFHHYVFFFLVVITVFVMWMIKFSLLFVIYEKNLSSLSSEMRSDFYFEENLEWIRKGGELDFLVSKVVLRILKLLPEELLVYIAVGVWFCSKGSKRVQKLNRFFYKSMTTTLGALSYDNSSTIKEVQFIKSSAIAPGVRVENTFLLLGPLYNRVCEDLLYWANLVNNNKLRGTSNIFTAQGSGSISLEASLIPTSLGTTSNLSKASFLSLYVINNIKHGQGTFKVSSWISSKNRTSGTTGFASNLSPLFVVNGLGLSFRTEAGVLNAFDENINLPQSFRFLEFYGLDLWVNPFLFFQNVRHRQVLEWVWTFIPTFILLLLVVPSLYLLYSYDRPYVTAPYLTFKAIGHQWYWSYEYFDYVHDEGGAVMFDSYMVHDDDLEKGQLRLLEVDRRVVLPTGVCIRMLTTSSDVLHSWAVPALGVKMDAVPGRLNQFWLVINRPGVFYGQCSELCGVNHGFMPIAIEAVYLDQYLEFILENCEAI